MRWTFIAAAIASLHLLTAQQALADQETSVETRATSRVFDNYSVRLGLESAGPILFRDTPDGRLEKTSVFQFGGSLKFLFGQELRDMHRFGMGVGYALVAKSQSRSLSFIDPYLIYETGHPLVLQVEAGGSIARGTKEFANSYGGLYGALALRYSFLRNGRSSPVSVSPGLVAKSYLVTSDAEMSSFFVGAQIEVAYNTDK